MSKATELSTSKVMAGGMAAATSAVLGSQFGAFGTVGGAAIGSVVTTVGTSLYQRSLDHARSRVTAKLPIPVGRGGPRPEAATAPARTGAATSPTTSPATSPATSAGTVGLARADGAAQKAPPAPRVPARHWARALVVGTALVFCLGLSLVTGVEWAKGSPLSGGPGGTSIGAVLERPPAPGEDTDGSTGTEDRDSDQRSGREERDDGGTDPTDSDRAPLPSAPQVPSAVPAPNPSLPVPLPDRLGGSDGSGSDGSGSGTGSDGSGSDEPDE